MTQPAFDLVEQWTDKERSGFAYCSASTDHQHFMVTHMRGGAPVSVRQCRSCRWIDFDDIRDQMTYGVNALTGQQMVRAVDRVRQLFGTDWALKPGAERLDVYAEVLRGPGWHAAYIDMRTGEVVPIPAVPADEPPDWGADIPDIDAAIGPNYMVVAIDDAEWCHYHEHLSVAERSCDYVGRAPGEVDSSRKALPAKVYVIVSTKEGGDGQ